MTRFVKVYAELVYRRPLFVLLIALLLSQLAFLSLKQLEVSTRLEALLPEGAPSVIALEEALLKTGSFASIQIVARSDTAGAARETLQQIKEAVDAYEWVDSSLYAEDIEIFERHQLLFLSLEELLELERDIEEAYPRIYVREASKRLGTAITQTIRSTGTTVDSRDEIETDRLDELDEKLGEPLETLRYFESEDGLTSVLVVWPKSGRDSLLEARQMTLDAANAVSDVARSDSNTDSVRVEIGGRIANKVAQFDAIMSDVRTGLLMSAALISLLIALSFRSLISIFVIVLPLALGIIWTLGVTAIVIGSLNLITIFLALILFGLGIDFGIHNYSRWIEERRAGRTVMEVVEIVLSETGRASLVAALTTSTGFYVLMLTEFRAFSEFGFIAGSGVLLIFASMYSVFLALMILTERVGISGRNRHKPRKSRDWPIVQVRPIFLAGIIILLMIGAAVFAPQITFERNFKNLEARQPAELAWANSEIRRVFPDGHDRAIIIADTQDELIRLERFFEDKIQADTVTPTIKRVSSILEFLPDQETQHQRLEVIRRLDDRNEQLRLWDASRADAAERYVSIDDLNLVDLPDTLIRTFVGNTDVPGFLLYIYNSVSMDDSEVAKLFYEDAALVKVGDVEYRSASEAFVFVEMLALMKSDAAKAILYVSLATLLIVLCFTREVSGAIIVLVPIFLGLGLTMAAMGLFGPKLSVMNMVILPSLIGISVDNAVHIFHRYRHLTGSDRIRISMNTTGRAAILTTLTTMLGFAGLVTASMGGLRTMGMLAIMGFSICLLLVWFLMPSLLKLHRTKDTGT